MPCEKQRSKIEELVFKSKLPSYTQNYNIFLMIHLYKFLVDVTNYSHSRKQWTIVTFHTITCL